MSVPALCLLALALPGCTGTLDRFEATLARQDSATAALGEWCGARGIADPPVIRAALVTEADAPPPADLRGMLDVDGNQSIGYRHVRLACGGTVLSEAHNWYVPSRLTPAMNAVLESTDTPFGKVAAPLQFTRRRIAEHRGALPGCPRGTVLSHRALLELPDGHPLSALVECYTAANLARR